MGGFSLDIHSGQASSDYPEMVEYLVEIGIDSISLNPDAVLKATLHILDREKRLGRSYEASATEVLN